MNSEEAQSSVFTFDNRIHHDEMENPLWRGDAPLDQGNTTAHRVCVGPQTASVEYPSAHQSACFYPGGNSGVVYENIGQPPCPITHQAMMMNNAVDLMRPVCPPPPRPVGPPAFPMHDQIPMMGYNCGMGPYRAQPTRVVLPEIDLSHRPGSLQEAICMYIDYLVAENEMRTRITECATPTPPPPLDFHREEYYREVMCRPVNFPTARFRDWLKRYNVDIEITDPDGQTVSQTTFAPATPVTEPADAGAVQAPESCGAGTWVNEEPETGSPQHGKQPAQRGAVICHAGASGSSPTPVQLGAEDQFLQLECEAADEVGCHGISGSDGLETGPTGLFPDHKVDDPEHHRSSIAASGCGYVSLPGEEKAELPVESEMPVSGWPHVVLEQPESARIQGSEEETVIYGPLEHGSAGAMRSTSADAYFTQGASSGIEAQQYDARCFASDEAAATDEQWAPGVMCSPVSTPCAHQLGPPHFAQMVLSTHPSSSQLDIHSGTAFPVVIEPSFPADPVDRTGRIPMTQELADCFSSMSEVVDNHAGAGYQLGYNDDAAADHPLYGPSAGRRVVAEAALAGTGRVAASTPPSQSTALDLGEDFADLLGARHSTDFDYHLNYGTALTSVTSDLVPEHPQHSAVIQKPQRGKCRARAANPKSAKVAFFSDDGPAYKYTREDPSKN